MTAEILIAVTALLGLNALIIIAALVLDIVDRIAARPAHGSGASHPLSRKTQEGQTMSALASHQRQLLGIAKTWALKNLPAWDEDCHRDLIRRHGAKRGTEGRYSALTMSGTQINAALADYEKRGWPRRGNYQTGTGETRRVPPQIAHIVRLWGRLGQAGKVEHATRDALLAFCARQTRREVRNLDALDAEEGVAIVEALKSWLAR